MLDTIGLASETRVRVQSLFEQGLQLNREERETLLKSGDPEVSQFVKELLERYDRSTVAMRSGTLTHARLIEYLAAGSHTFATGDLLAGRFEIIRFIAEGGMGEVYEAEDRELGGAVAVKTIRPALSLSAATIAAFKREIRLARRVTHNNVCRVFDVFRHVSEDGSSVAFLTMELLEGPTLAQHLAANGPIPFSTATRLIREIASALDCAHALDIIHRDLKPSNVMLVKAGDQQPRAIVTDFGLAVSVEPESGSATVKSAGTPAYMAPEQASGDAIVPQTDLYAFGLLICEMLTGDHPRMDRGVSSYASWQLRRWFASHPKLDSRIRRAVTHCLRFQPEDRPKSAAKVVAVIEDTSRRRIATLVASLAALCLLIGITLTFFVHLEDQVASKVQVTPDDVMSGDPALSADGKYVVYYSNQSDPGSTEIWLQKTVGGSPIRITNDHRADDQPSISPDGKLVAFHSARGGGVYTIGADGKGEKLLVPGGKNPVFSPDGREIAYWVGADDFRAPSKLYLYSPADGSTRQLAADFRIARSATWALGTPYLVFWGSGGTGQERADWWIVDPKDGRPRPTGVYRRIRAAGFLPFYDLPQVVLFQGRLILPARRQYRYELWDVPLSPEFSARRPIRHLDSAEADDEILTISANGQIATEHDSGMLNIWEVPIDRSSATPQKITEGLTLEGAPALTPDQRWLYSIRELGRFTAVFRRDLRSGQQTQVYSSDSGDTLWPVPDLSGERVAFEARSAQGSSILLKSRQGIQRLCLGCYHPANWIVDGRDLLYRDSSGGLSVVDVPTGQTHSVLRVQPGTIVIDADWSPKAERLAFTVSRGSSTQVFGAKLPRATELAEGNWIALTSSSEDAIRARWSKDGKSFFFFSRRDGHYCLWRKFVDTVSGEGGRVVEVQHYPDLAEGPDQSTADWLDIAVADQLVYSTVAKETATVWLGRVRWNQWTWK